MTFRWSANAEHIHTLFLPYKPGDGVSAGELAAVHFPVPPLLQSFYRSWGRRIDMTRYVQYLLAPSELFIQSEALIFCVENQGVYYWGIPCSAMHEADPPVTVALNEGTDLLWQPSHDHLSDFLDYLTYGHALAGGSQHGGYAQEWMDDQKQALLEQHYTARILPSYPAGFTPDPHVHPWSLLVGSDCVLDTNVSLAVASATIEVLDQVQDLLQITWKYRW